MQRKVTGKCLARGKLLAMKRTLPVKFRSQKMVGELAFRQNFVRHSITNCYVTDPVLIQYQNEP